MQVSETNLIEKQCNTCNTIKHIDMFGNKLNICKQCRNAKTRMDYANIDLSNIVEQKCNDCNIVKPIHEYHKGRKICLTCTNIKRRDRYSNNDTYRERVKKEAYNYRKSINWAVSSIEKFKHKIRGNIAKRLKSKTKKTIEYIGCSKDEYIKWLLFNSNDYNLENHGEVWHIDHVIPISHFDIENEEQLLIAFNWRNTAPLSVIDNLKKGNKIIQSQIDSHYKNLLEYHIKNNIDLPQTFINLFATPPNCGKSPKDETI